MVCGEVARELGIRRGPAHTLGDLSTGRAQGVLLRVTPGHPHLAAQGGDGRGVDDPLHHGVTQGYEVPLLGGVALQDNVGETLVLTLVNLRLRGDLQLLF